MNARPNVHLLVRPLASRSFALYSAGNGASLIGTWAHRLASGWLIWEMTGSATLLGLIVFADLIPPIVIAPLAGAIADRFDKIRVLMICQTAGAIQALILAVLVLTGLVSPWLLLALTLVHGVIEAFAHPARLSLVHDLVPREQLGSAVAFNAIVFNVARFIGPALAGALITFFGVGFSYLANSLSFVCFLAALAAIPVAAPPVQRERAGIWAEIVSGARYAVTTPVIGNLFLLMIVLGLCVRPLIELLPGFAPQAYGSTAAGLAVLTSSVALGALAGGVWLGGQADHAPRIHIMGISGVAFCIGTVFLTVTPTLWLGALVLLAVGFANVGSFITAQTLLQLECAPEMRGRVLSIYGMVFRGCPALGALILGGLAEGLGFRIPLAAAAIIALIAIVPIWRSLARTNAPGAKTRSPNLPDRQKE